MKTLLIDNYDSFSRILFQYLWDVNGQEPIFIQNDEWTLERLLATDFDNILISPGPGHPKRKQDFGICGEVLKVCQEIPILGVCLGHQGMGIAAGAKVMAAPQVRHGKASRILHSGTGIFSNIPSAFSAIRYHSLVIDPTSIPEGLQVTATAEEDGQIMAIQSRRHPHFGVQFHPESIGTENGKALLRNFRDLSLDFLSKRNSKPEIKPKIKIATKAATETENETYSLPSDLPKSISKQKEYGPELQLLELPWREPEAVFLSLFKSCAASFWLDSQIAPRPREPRITYMGTGSRIMEARDGEVLLWKAEPGMANPDYKIESKFRSDPFTYLDRYLQDSVPPRFPMEKEFGEIFTGGLVGYFGYGSHSSTKGKSGRADALFLEPDRLLAFDHEKKRVFAYSPSRLGLVNQDLEDWYRNLKSHWDALSFQKLELVQSGSLAAAPSALRLPWKLSAQKSEYLARIQKIKSHIMMGETYEACLTNEVSVKVGANLDPLRVYQLLRRTNPAPYSAYMHFPQRTILSASPERFLKLDSERRLSSRPIKGTRRRGVDAEEDISLKGELANNPKDISENLMIVDLVRNDFGKVCELGTVKVPEFMVVETHPTVFQLVSGVEGILASGQSALDAVRACFPGGSMTGAPKKRTMEILAEIEKRERGVFSGALGILGFNGTADLGMVIRTLVFENGSVSIGCGGAILAESDPEAEFSEILLKAYAVQRAVELAVFGECGGWRMLSIAEPKSGD